MTELEIHRGAIAADLRIARSHLFSAIVCIPTSMTTLRSDLSALLTSITDAIASPPAVPTVSLDDLLDGSSGAVTEMAYAYDLNNASAMRIASGALQATIDGIGGPVLAAVRDVALQRILSAGWAARDARKVVV